MIDIEKHEELHEYLKKKQLIQGDKLPEYVNLTGGVSNRCVLVSSDVRALVVKQALEKLRVKEKWECKPERIHQEALGLRHLIHLTPQQNAPTFIFEDFEQHILVMEAVPAPHDNLKTLLLKGEVQLTFAEQFGKLLGSIHANSHDNKEYKAIFSETYYFDALRLNPYYSFTAQQLPETTTFLNELIRSTKKTKLSLVHGDYSPKNILIHHEKLFLLDHEVIHYGDPAFDIGFSMTHLLSKMLHLYERREDFFNFCLTYWNAYRQNAAMLMLLRGFEARAVQHTLACLLARVKGKSPLEYLDQNEQEFQLNIVLSLLRNTPASMDNLIHNFFNAVQTKCIQ